MFEQDAQRVKVHGAGDAAGKHGQVVLDPFRQFCRGHDIGDRQPAPGLQDPPGLAEDLLFFLSQVDDAIGNDHVDRLVRHRQVLNLAQAEGDMAEAGFLRVLARQVDHIRRHVHPDHQPLRTDPTAGQKTVEAAAGTQVEHCFAGF